MTTSLRRASSCLALAAIALLGCGGPRPGAAGATPTGSASPGVANGACAAVDLDAIAPKRLIRSGRTVPIADLYPRAPARAAGDAPMSVNLGTISPSPSGEKPFVASYPIPGPPFARASVDAGVREAIRPAFDRWIQAVERRSADARADRLLERRLWGLGGARRGDGETERPPDQACAQADWSRAHDQLVVSSGDAERLRGSLADALRALSDPSAEERVVLAELMIESVSTDHVDVPRTRADAASLLRGVVDDTSASTELRVAAASRIVDLPDPSKLERSRTRAAEFVVPVSSEPRFVVPAAFHLARQIPDAEARLAKLRALARDAEGEPALAFDRGRIFVEIGIALRALEQDEEELRAWTDCVAASVEDEDSDRDPFGCVTELGRATVRAGGTEDRSIAVPVELVGAAAASIAHVAAFVRDWEGVTRVAEAGLGIDPDAREGPRILSILAEITPDARARAALLERRSRDYGSDTPWFAREWRHALEVGAIATPLGPLFTAPPDLSAAPTTDDGLRLDLDARANWVVRQCAEPLYDSGAMFTVRVDATTLPVTTTVTASQPGAVGAHCLERAAAPWFRSVPAVVVTWTVFRPLAPPSR